jgi:hypothetical protein
MTWGIEDTGRTRAGIFHILEGATGGARDFVPFD